jgi:rhodanese-related sulfurtransferase
MAGVRPIVDEVDPVTAYRLLASAADSALVDVRSRAEWTFVGVPDIAATGRPLWLIEWAAFPGMTRNAAFLDELAANMEREQPARLFFLCRSGARSMAAAQAVAEAFAARGAAVQCTNIAEGFEGDLDGDGHRGRITGWKVRGLPWRQS